MYSGIQKIFMTTTVLLILLISLQRFILENDKDISKVELDEIYDLLPLHDKTIKVEFYHVVHLINSGVSSCSNSTSIVLQAILYTLLRSVLRKV